MAETVRGKTIRDFIISKVTSDGAGIALLTAKKFGISRQGVNKYLRQLVKDGILDESGSTRAKVFSLKKTSILRKIYVIKNGLAEDKVYSQDILPLIRQLQTREEVERRISYCFSEIFNNAIDHSEGEEIRVSVLYDALNFAVLIMDNGIGIFKKIQDSFHLENEREAILELSKGKLTTSKENHSGEGIFFSSRICDSFFIRSHMLSFSYAHILDLQLEETKYREGTSVLMEFVRDSTKTSKEIFDKFSSQDGDYGFTVTHVPVDLAMTGSENLVSRSQAKRLLAGLEKFEEVGLDFRDVDTIGQAFADEIFRVYANAHAEINIIYFNANEEVTKMINRALTLKREEEKSEGST